MVHLKHLGQRRRLVENNVVRQYDGERLVAHLLTGGENGVAQPQRLFLTHKAYTSQFSESLHLFQHLRRDLALERFL